MLCGTVAINVSLKIFVWLLDELDEINPLSMAVFIPSTVNCGFRNQWETELKKRAKWAREVTYHCTKRGSCINPMIITGSLIASLQNCTCSVQNLVFPCFSLVLIKAWRMEVWTDCRLTDWRADGWTDRPTDRPYYRLKKCEDASLMNIHCNV